MVRIFVEISFLKNISFLEAVLIPTSTMPTSTTKMTITDVYSTEIIKTTKEMHKYITRRVNTYLIISVILTSFIVISSIVTLAIISFIRNRNAYFHAQFDTTELR